MQAHQIWAVWPVIAQNENARNCLTSDWYLSSINLLLQFPRWCIPAYVCGFLNVVVSSGHSSYRYATGERSCRWLCGECDAVAWMYLECPPFVNAVPLLPGRNAGAPGVSRGPSIRRSRGGAPNEPYAVQRLQTAQVLCQQRKSQQINPVDDGLQRRVYYSASGNILRELAATAGHTNGQPQWLQGTAAADGSLSRTRHEFSTRPAAATDILIHLMERLISYLQGRHRCRPGH